VLKDSYLVLSNRE